MRLEIGQSVVSIGCRVERLPDGYSALRGHGPRYQVRTGWGSSWCEDSLGAAFRELAEALEGRGLSPGNFRSWAEESTNE